MNSLLKRQIRKYLTEELKNSESLTDFINAVDKSYDNFDEQSAMIQRAMAISSDELFAANRRLQEEAEEQKKLIAKLKSVIDTLKFYNLKDENEKEGVELSGEKLIDFIDNQTKEIVEINKQKEELLNELAHQNEELSDYAHMVSHDLKSPLRSIDTLTAWLKEDYNDLFDENGKSTLTLIRNNVEKMDTLIKGILEYSAIGQNKTEIYNVNLNKLIDSITSAIGIPEHIHLTKHKLPTVQGDKFRLQQLFQNLLSNAIKYNDKKRGEIEIGVEDKKRYWQFFVKDNGKGIEEAYFNKIFETFEKLENNEQSSGIGLSIVKKIVDLYGGKVWLTSKISHGSTFYFTLKKSLNGNT